MFNLKQIVLWLSEEKDFLALVAVALVVNVVAIALVLIASLVVV